VHVAPYVGAWIEIVCDSLETPYKYVAPYVGAWIEIILKSFMYPLAPSRTLRGCVD